MADIKDTINSTGGALDDISQKVKDLGANWEAVGSSSSAALGVLSAGLRGSNPLLSQAIGSCQKMVPLLMNIAKAAKTSGAALKAAFAETGIGLLVVAVTEAISFITELHSKSRQAAKDAHEEAVGFLADLQAENKKYNESKLSEDAKYAGKRDEILKKMKQAEQDWNADLAKYTENDDRTKASKKLYKDYVDALNQYDANHAEQVKVNNAKIEKANAESAKKNAEIARQAWETMLGGLMSTIEDVTDELDIQDDVTLELIDNTKILGEWLSRNMSEEDKKIAALNLRAEEYKKAGADELEVEQWLADEKAKIYTSGLQSQLDAMVDAEKKEEESIKQRREAYKEFGSNCVELFGTISDAVSKNLEAELQSGKITEQEYKKKKETLKAFSIAQIAAQTALGIANVWTAYSEKSVAEGGITAPINAALAAAQTAIQLASGVAGIAAVKSESLGGASTGSSASVSYSAPQAQQVYVQNDNAEQFASLENTFKSQQTVLVLEDFNKVKDNHDRVKVQASF